MAYTPAIFRVFEVRSSWVECNILNATQKAHFHAHATYATPKQAPIHMYCVFGACVQCNSH